MRVAELEMLLLVLLEKKIIKKEDFKKYHKDFEKKLETKFKDINKRKKIKI